MNEVLVLMDAIDKSFPGVHALNQCRFELHSGEVHALVGENGAGKSTMMKILSGIYRKDAGRILYKGKEVEIPNPRSAQLLGISMIHQELNLMPHLTVAQNIFIGREPRAGLFLNEKEINDKTQELLALMHLKLDPRLKVGELTVAKQQMVEIAKALSFNSEVLIMDEPTAALTDTEIAELFRIIRQLREKGVGIVHISHRLEELKQISDRITVMRDVPVVGFDSGVDSDIPVTTAATDNIAAAAAAADKMAELIGSEGGNVAIVAHDQTSRTGIDRVKGFTDQVTSKYPNLKIVDTQYGGGDQLKSTDLTKAIIQANPDIKGIFGANEGSIIGVLNAVKELGKEGQIVVIGYDAGKQQKDAVRSGVEAGAITQDPVGIGYKCVEAAVKAINGETLPKTIDTGFKWYDKTNVDSDEMKPLLYD